MEIDSAAELVADYKPRSSDEDVVHAVAVDVSSAGNFIPDSFPPIK